MKNRKIDKIEARDIVDWLARSKPNLSKMKRKTEETVQFIHDGLYPAISSDMGNRVASCGPGDFEWCVLVRNGCLLFQCADTRAEENRIAFEYGTKQSRKEVSCEAWVKVEDDDIEAVYDSLPDLVMAVFNEFPNLHEVLKVHISAGRKQL